MDEEFIIIGNEDAPKQKRIYVSEFNGKKYLHLREFYRSDKDDKYFPTKKGITFKVEGTELDEVMEAINSFKEE